MSCVRGASKSLNCNVGECHFRRKENERVGYGEGGDVRCPFYLPMMEA